MWSEYDPLSGSTVRPNSTKPSSLIGRGEVACTLPLCDESNISWMGFDSLDFLSIFGLGLALSRGVLHGLRPIQVLLSWTEEIGRLRSSSIYKT